MVTKDNKDVGRMSRAIYDHIYEVRATLEGVPSVSQRPTLDSRIQDLRRESVIAHMGNGSGAIDLGCGAGHWLSHLRQRFECVVGVDHSPEGVRQARNRCREAYVMIGDVQRTSFCDRSFDFVMLIEVVEHLDKPENSISEAYRILRPGGRLLITTPNRMEYRRLIYDLVVLAYEKSFRVTQEEARARVLRKYVDATGYHLDGKEMMKTAGFVGHFPISRRRLVDYVQKSGFSVDFVEYMLFCPPLANIFNKNPWFLSLWEGFERRTRHSWSSCFLGSTLAVMCTKKA